MVAVQYDSIALIDWMLCFYGRRPRGNAGVLFIETFDACCYQLGTNNVDTDTMCRTDITKRVPAWTVDG